MNYEITQSIARGNGVLAIRIHHLKDRLGVKSLAGATPKGGGGGWPQNLLLLKRDSARQMDRTCCSGRKEAAVATVCQINLIYQTCYGPVITDRIDRLPTG